MNTNTPCGLHGCTNPTDPDSGIGLCQDCTLQFELEILRINEIDLQQRAARTRRAPVDAVLLARAFLADDEPSTVDVLKNCDPHSVALQLCGFLYATLRQFDVDIEERLSIWLTATRAQIGEQEES